MLQDTSQTPARIIRRMHLLIPFASSLSDAAGEVIRDISLPTLTTLLRKLTATHRDEADEYSLSPPHERALARAWGWPAVDGGLPFAARAAAADGVAVGGQAWALLTPTHWDVGRDHITLTDPTALALREDESRQLFEAVRGLFESEGFTLAWGAPSRWYAAHPSLAELRCAALDRVIGRNVDLWLRGGASSTPTPTPAARLLRRLQSEVQLLLYPHAVNEAREARGELTVNSFWLSGCGVHLASDDSLVQARRFLAHGPVLTQDWAAWAEAWRALDAGPLATLLSTLERGEPAGLTLCGERHAQSYEHQSLSLLERTRRRWSLPRAKRSTGGLVSPPTHLPAAEPAGPTIVLRDVPPRAAWALEQAGVHPLLARLFAARGLRSADDLDDGLARLLAPTELLGAPEAARFLADTIAAGHRVCVVADYDCDGATACAVALRGLHMLGAAPDTLHYVVPDRAVHGYGLTPAIVDLALQKKPQVLLTVDNGIASLQGVAHARAMGLNVVVTDHHLPALEDGTIVLPEANVIVNPNQPGCTFASKNLAGVGVMFYVLLALRGELRARGVFTAQTQPRLDALLDLVALGTVADVVRLDANNRRLVAQGLKRIRAGRMQPGVAALFSAAGRDARRASGFDFGFALGPRINAAGRLSDMTLGIECLLTDDPCPGGRTGPHAGHHQPRAPRGGRQACANRRRCCCRRVMAHESRLRRHNRPMRCRSSTRRSTKVWWASSLRG